MGARLFGRVCGRVRHIALGLADLGIQPGDRVGLISENRPEWSIADLAVLSAGAVVVPIYTTQAPDQIRFILEDSGARALLISGGRILKHAREGFEAVDTLRDIVIFDPKSVGGVRGGVALESVEGRGAEIDRQDPTLRQPDRRGGRRSRDDHLHVRHYGRAEGVMLTNDNFIANVRSITTGLPISASDVSLSVLPLSHIFERTVFYVFAYVGVAVHYAASFDQVGEFLREVRPPTIMTAVPRLFEKVYHRIIKKGMSAGGAKDE